MISKQKVIALAQERIDELGNGNYLVEVKISSKNAISVKMDNLHSGVSIKDCVSVSRNIEHNLDRESEDFELQVSSPGLDHPFKVIEQYQKNISLIPQDIFIAEQSFSQNIALGLNDIEIKRVQLCAKIAEIDKFIKSNVKQYNSVISHNGSNLSGGQKQRIGIARGLYKDSNIIIFDESTNSLDEKTEKKIFKNFDKYLKTKIIIAISHDKKNINFFNKIFTIVNGKLIRIKPR